MLMKNNICKNLIGLKSRKEESNAKLPYFVNHQLLDKKWSEKKKGKNIIIPHDLEKFKGRHERPKRKLNEVANRWDCVRQTSHYGRWQMNQCYRWSIASRAQYCTTKRNERQMMTLLREIPVSADAGIDALCNRVLGSFFKQRLRLRQRKRRF